MKKVKIVFLSLMMVFACFSYSNAFSYSFYGTDDGGVGSAEMDINISGNILTVSLDNTSPTTYGDNKVNNPCITGFGFNLTNNGSVGLISWIFEAETYNSSTKVTIGSSTESDNEYWDISQDTNWDGLIFNYLPHVENGHNGALYNPALKSFLGEGSQNTHNYFTNALLTVNYSDAPLLGSDVVVRMTRVGEDGSLKLEGKPAVPEPGTMLLLGSLASGLFGFAGLKKRFTK